MISFLTWYIFLLVGKTQDLSSKFGKLLKMLLQDHFEPWAWRSICREKPTGEIFPFL
jgi:hypothetical protein